MEENVKNEEKKTSLGSKVWNCTKKLGTGLILVGIGTAIGYIGRKYLDKDVYADAAEQRAWRERKAASSN